MEELLEWMTVESDADAAEDIKVQVQITAVKLGGITVEPALSVTRLLQLNCEARVNIVG